MVDGWFLVAHRQFIDRFPARGSCPAGRAGAQSSAVDDESSVDESEVSAEELDAGLRAALKDTLAYDIVKDILVRHFTSDGPAERKEQWLTHLVRLYLWRAGRGRAAGAPQPTRGGRLFGARPPRRRKEPGAAVLPIRVALSSSNAPSSLQVLGMQRCRPLSASVSDRGEPDQCRLQEHRFADGRERTRCHCGALARTGQSVPSAHRHCFG